MEFFRGNVVARAPLLVNLMKRPKRCRRRCVGDQRTPAAVLNATVTILFRFGTWISRTCVFGFLNAD